MKRRLLIAVPLLALVAWPLGCSGPRRETLGEAFISEKAAPLLSSIAQVREQIGHAALRRACGHRRQRMIT